MKELEFNSNIEAKGAMKILVDVAERMQVKCYSRKILDKKVQLWDYPDNVLAIARSIPDWQFLKEIGLGQNLLKIATGQEDRFNTAVDKGGEILKIKEEVIEVINKV